MTLQDKIRKEATITVQCLPEDIEVRGNCMASGDDAVDKECEDRIVADLENGNDWAWCTVKVTAEWNGITGVDYLGCCSYDSEKDFRQPGGYFDNMVANVIAEINQKARTIARAMVKTRKPRLTAVPGKVQS